MAQPALAAPAGVTPPSDPKLRASSAPTDERVGPATPAPPATLSWPDWRATLPDWFGDDRYTDITLGTISDAFRASVDRDVPRVQWAEASPTQDDPSQAESGHASANAAAFDQYTSAYAAQARRPWKAARFHFVGWNFPDRPNGALPVRLPDFAGSDFQAPASAEASLDWYASAFGAPPDGPARSEALQVLKEFEVRRRECVVRILDRIVELAQTEGLGREPGVRGQILMGRRLVLLRDGQPPGLEVLVRRYREAWPATIEAMRAEVGAPTGAEYRRLAEEFARPGSEDE